jgi:hypothetical protein
VSPPFSAQLDPTVSSNPGTPIHNLPLKHWQKLPKFLTAPFHLVKHLLLTNKTYSFFDDRFSKLPGCVISRSQNNWKRCFYAASWSAAFMMSSEIIDNLYIILKN